MPKQSTTKQTLSLLGLTLERTESQANDPIAFRPGPEMSGVIAEFARKHKLNGETINRSEVCNRIVCLGLARFDVHSNYLPVCELARIVGGRNAFANTCFQILQVVRYNERHLPKPLPSDLATHVISSLLEVERNRIEAEINAGTEARVSMSKE